VTRFLVTWRNRSLGRTFDVGLLTAAADGFAYSYLPGTASVPGFRPFVNFPDLDRQYRSPRLFPFFSQRIMEPRRPDYLTYLQALALPADATSLDVLGRTNGQRKGDSVHVVREPDVADDGRVDHVFLVSGGRHAVVDGEGAWRTLSAADPLTTRPEPTNPANPEALQIWAPTVASPLGWVPDALIRFVGEVSASPHRLTVERLNGEDWPAHLRTVVRLVGVVPIGFEPFALARERTTA